MLDDAIRLTLLAFLILGCAVLGPLVGRQITLNTCQYGDYATEPSHEYGGAAQPTGALESEHGKEQSPAADQRAEARDKADVSAQQSMACAAWMQFGIGVVGLIGLGLTVAFASMAWREAKRSADIAERELYVLKAPRLFPRKPHFSWTESKPRLEFFLHNGGSSKAILSLGTCGFGFLRLDIALLSEEPRPMKLLTRIKVSEPMLLPDKDATLTMEGDKAFEAGEIKAVEARDAAVFVRGLVHYMDHLGDWQKFEFEAVCGDEADVLISVTQQDARKEEH